jgi:hypothetical protein
VAPAACDLAFLCDFLDAAFPSVDREDGSNPREDRMATATEAYAVPTHFPARLMPGGWGRHLPAAQTVALKVSARSMELEMPDELYGSPPTVGDLFWVTVDLGPERSIRPLVQVSDVRGSSVLVQYRHMFPDHRALLEEYRETQASDLGY